MPDVSRQSIDGRSFPSQPYNGSRHRPGDMLAGALLPPVPVSLPLVAGFNPRFAAARRVAPRIREEQDDARTQPDATGQRFPGDESGRGEAEAAAAPLDA